MARIREMRDGKDYDGDFASCTKGHRIWTDLIKQRFEKACRGLGFKRERVELEINQFKPTANNGRARLFLTWSGRDRNLFDVFHGQQVIALPISNRHFSSGIDHTFCVFVAGYLHHDGTVTLTCEVDVFVQRGAFGAD